MLREELTDEVVRRVGPVARERLLSGFAFLPRRAHAYVLTGDTDFPTPQPSLRLLSEYDVYVMGFREREYLVPEAVKAQLAAHPRGRYEGPAGVRLVLIDGIAAGVWERKKRGKRVELRIAPTRRLTKAQRAELDAETERIGTFLGVEPVVAMA